MPGSPRTLPCTGAHRSSCSDAEVFLSVGLSPETVPFLLPCTSPLGRPPSASVRQYSDVLIPHRAACSASAAFSSAVQRNVIFPFDSLPCRKGNLKILLSKARKARIVRQGHFLLYIYMPHGNTHSANTLHSHTLFSFFPAIPTTEHGERSRVRAEKTAQRSCSGFFQIRTCEALDSFGVWSYLCRPKREKSFIAVMPFCGYDKHIHNIFINFIDKPILLVHLP